MEVNTTTTSGSASLHFDVSWQSQLLRFALRPPEAEPAIYFQVKIKLHWNNEHIRKVFEATPILVIMLKPSELPLFVIVTSFRIREKKLLKRKHFQAFLGKYRAR